jgi:hypothetical protein
MKVYEITERTQVNELENMPVAQKIEPIKMSNPPKAPDATIPRTRDGYTTDDGTTYKQDQYDENIMHVSNGGGTYTFDGSRLIKWTTPKIQGYRQIHDFVQRTIKVDSDTTVLAPEGGEVVISTKAVYDLEGNLQNGGELSMSAGDVSLTTSAEKMAFSWVYSNLRITITGDPSNPDPRQDPDLVADFTKKYKENPQALKPEFEKYNDGDSLADYIKKYTSMIMRLGGKVQFSNPQTGAKVSYADAIKQIRNFDAEFDAKKANSAEQ